MARAMPLIWGDGLHNKHNSSGRIMVVHRLVHLFQTGTRTQAHCRSLPLRTASLHQHLALHRTHNIQLISLPCHHHLLLRFFPPPPIPPSFSSTSHPGQDPYANFFGGFLGTELSSDSSAECATPTTIWAECTTTTTGCTTATIG